MALAAWATASALSAASCVPSPRMCASEPDCGPGASCVAGRCLKYGAVAALTTAHRWLYAPVDAAYVARGRGGTGGSSTEAMALPAVATFGRGDGAIAFFRFSITLPPEANVLEAYLLLPRAPGVESDPDPIALHAVRVTDAWEGSSVTWVHPPRVVDLGAPVTRVAPATGLPVRLDVRAIVERWRRRPEGEFGIAVVTEGQSATGVAFALEPGPELELYVK